MAPFGFGGVVAAGCAGGLAMLTVWMKDNGRLVEGHGA